MAHIVQLPSAWEMFKDIFLVAFTFLWALFKATWQIWLFLFSFMFLLVYLKRKINPAYESRYGGLKTFIDEKGYRRFLGSGKLVHRWVAEKKLGRKLHPGEIVHHINQEKLDNRPDNLEILPNQEIHDDIHREEGIRL